MENNREVLLKVEHLCQYFRLGRKDLKAVDDVSFEIRKGETFGLVGESGCGKTTTGRSIIKLYNITSGNVYFKGQRIGAGTRSYKDAIKQAKKDLEDKKITKQEYDEIVARNRALIKDAKLDSKAVDRQHAQSLVKALEVEYAERFAAAAGDSEQLKALRKEYKNRVRVAAKSKLITQIQMIFQDPIASLDPRMTVRDIIAEGLVINGVTDQEYINQKVYEILETVGLVREHADRYPHEFSGGQRQRICIARALALKPQLVVCDEPVSALDVSIQAQIINMLKELQKELNLSYLFISHDLSVVKHISDEVGVMYLGSMVEYGTKERIFENTLHPYTKALFSAAPVPNPHAKKNRVILKGDIPSPVNPPAGCKFHTRCEKCMEICKKVTPEYREVEPGHFCACHLYDEE